MAKSYSDKDAGNSDGASRDIYDSVTKHHHNYGQRPGPVGSKIRDMDIDDYNTDPRPKR